MSTAGRIIAGVIGLLAAYSAYRTIRTNAWLPITLTSGSFEVTVALMAFWFAGVGHIPSEQVMFTRTLLIGGIVGAIAFVAGTVGLMILAPGNQGPLVGIFAIGPAGFAAGWILGFIWVRYRQPAAPHARPGA